MNTYKWTLSLLLALLSTFVMAQTNNPFQNRLNTPLGYAVKRAVLQAQTDAHTNWGSALHIQAKSPFHTDNTLLSATSTQHDEAVNVQIAQELQAAPKTQPNQSSNRRCLLCGRIETEQNQCIPCLQDPDMPCIFESANDQKPKKSTSVSSKKSSTKHDAADKPITPLKKCATCGRLETEQNQAWPCRQDPDMPCFFEPLETADHTTQETAHHSFRDNPNSTWARKVGI